MLSVLLAGRHNQIYTSTARASVTQSFFFFWQWCRNIHGNLFYVFLFFAGFGFCSTFVRF